MKNEIRDSIIYKGKEIPIIYKTDTGYVWYLDEKGYKTNIGQVRPIHSLEEAKKAVITMLKSMGPREY